MEKKNNDAKTYPGVAIDKADNDRVTPCEVKESTKAINNNPRNNDDKMP